LRAAALSRPLRIVVAAAVLAILARPAAAGTPPTVPPTTPPTTTTAEAATAAAAATGPPAADGVFRANLADPAGRVARARARLRTSLPATFRAHGVAWPPREVFLRATKEEADGSPGVVELWAGNGRAPLVLVLSHRICALSGTLGPKRREGDGQIPEGFYSITLLNPTSTFHLSMLVDYPNASDRIRGRLDDPKAALGGSIMVHGNCVTIGCIPVKDEPIEEIYLAVAEALRRGPVPIHVFPRRLDDNTALAALQTTTTDATTRALWAELAEGWQAFERTRRVPRGRVGADGGYVVQRASSSSPSSLPLSPATR
jgi:murein L,D-transpeptidase YafK